MTVIEKLFLGGIALLMSSVIYAQNPANSTGDAAPSAAVNPVAQGGAGKKGVRIENRHFSSAIQRAIYKDHAVNDADIVVFGNAATGKVVLAGFISEQDQEQAALNAARRVPGVKEVTSNLTLREEGN